MKIAMSDLLARIAENVGRVRHAHGRGGGTGRPRRRRRRLVAVTKYVGPAEIRALVEAGCSDWAKAARNSFGQRPR